MLGRAAVGFTCTGQEGMVSHKSLLVINIKCEILSILFFYLF